MKTNEQILSEVKSNGFITYTQISLLKNRSNKANQDVINYDDNFEGFRIDVAANPLNYERELVD